MEIEFRPEAMQLARAYVPYQRWEQIYTPTEALMRGTVFPSLHQAGENQWYSAMGVIE